MKANSLFPWETIFKLQYFISLKFIQEEIKEEIDVYFGLYIFLNKGKGQFRV